MKWVRYKRYKVIKSTKREMKRYLKGYLKKIKDHFIIYKARSTSTWIDPTLNWYLDNSYTRNWYARRIQALRPDLYVRVGIDRLIAPYPLILIERR